MCNFQEHLFYGTPPVAASIFKKLPFSVLIFSDENNIAKLAFDMWGNCSSRLWYSLETYNSFLKSLQYRCLPVNFPKFLKTSFLQKTSEQLVLYFFLFILLFCTRWTNRNQPFYFWACFITAFKRDEYHESKRPSCCCMEAHISRWYHMEFSGVLKTD